MSESQELLREYSLNGSETAFRQIVACYINFVYSTARRLVDGNTQLAEDVTQTVFINLAAKARTFSSAVTLGGWLHRHTFHVATKAARAERRRQGRERKALEMSILQEDDSNDRWERVSPLLDEAISGLPGDDRLAILLRFFEQRDFRSVGQALGSTEDAARMRVRRALEKLNLSLRKRGIEVSAAALASALAAEAVSAAPAGLAAATATIALTHTAAGTGLTLILFKTMATLPVKVSVAALIVLGTATTLVLQHQSHLARSTQTQALLRQIDVLAEANDALSNRLARATQARTPRLPAPPLSTAAAPPWSGDTGAMTNLYSLMTNKSVKLSAGQLDHYLEANRRNVASLLAAFRTTGQAELLEEAMQSFPDHPQVAFEAALRKDAPPEERRRWLDVLKHSEPENALANYLSAADYFKAGQTDQAVQELTAASAKTAFKDYTLDRVQDDEEAYRAAGYSIPESKLVANSQLLLPQLVQVKELSSHILDLANSYRQAGDEGSRQAVLEMAVNLGRRYSEPVPGETLISELLGVAVERNSLAAMDPHSPYFDTGRTVQERLDELGQRRSAIRELNQTADPLWKNLSDEDWMSYNSRSLAFGEHAALQWLVGKGGQP